MLILYQQRSLSPARTLLMAIANVMHILYIMSQYLVCMHDEISIDRYTEERREARVETATGKKL